MSITSKLKAPDLERLARRPCPMASLHPPVPAFSGRPWRFRAPGRPGPAEGGRKLCPAVRSTHIDNTDRFQAGSGWLDPRNSRGSSPLTTQRQNFFSAVSNRCWYIGSAGTVSSAHLLPPVTQRTSGSRPTCCAAAGPYAFRRPPRRTSRAA